MAEGHIQFYELQRIRAANRDLVKDDLVDGRHLPYQLGFDVVKAVMAEAGQTEFVPEYRDQIPDEIALRPSVREAVGRHIEETHPDGHGTVDYPGVVASMWSLHGAFVHGVEQEVDGLNKAKETFQERLVQAAQSQRLPLKAEQIRDRLSQATLGFKARFEDEDAHGNYYPQAGMAFVNQGYLGSGNVGYSGSRNLRTVYHELLHVADGKRFIRSNEEETNLVVRKSGLKAPNATREWMDEAFTEILTAVLLDERGETIDFADAKQSITEVGNGVILDILGVKPDFTMEDDPHSYTSEKIALLKTMSKVPFGTLVRAYFSQDFDPHEADQYAGSRAEKELQRAIKVASGAGRISELRLVNNAFVAGDEQTALDVAGTIHAKDSHITRRAKFVNKTKVSHNSRTIKSKIRQAKRLAA